MRNERTSLLSSSFVVAVLGYALFLVINACSLWGGVFPFFPTEFHAGDVTFSFMLAQSLSSLLTYIGMSVASIRMSSLIARPLHGASSLPAFLGGMVLIASLYLPDQRLVLVSVAGCFMGIGGALLSLVWARYISAESLDQGNALILFGTMTSPFLFMILHAVPMAVRVFLTPLVFVPLCGLAVLLSFKSLDKSLPVFQDDPSANIPVYIRIVRVYWKSAFAIGTLGFASGLVRAVAVADVRYGDLTNIISFFGLLTLALVLYLFWRKRSFTLNVRFVFMLSFPLVAVCLALFPFANGRTLALLSGLVFVLFSFANIVVMLQSAHICSNRGCNPFFVYGFFGSLVGLLQNAGFIFGHVAMMIAPFGVHTRFAASIIGLLVMTMTLYAFVGKNGLFTSDLPQYDNVEFIAFGKDRTPLALLVDGSSGREADDGTRETIELSEEDYRMIDEPVPPGFEEADPQPRVYPRGPSRITMRCKMIQEQYRLTSRETEIMELIVRGYSAPMIAEEYVVSENTVRTHYKHIYSKLGIHKKQELIALVDSLKDS